MKGVAPALGRQTGRRLLYLLTALPLAPLWLALLLGGWLLAGLTSITPLVVPAAVALRSLTSAAARVEASLARRLLGADVEPPRRVAGHGYWGRLGAALGDPGLWREQAFLVLRMLLGGASAIGAGSALAFAFFLIFLPLSYQGAGGEEVIWHVDSRGHALAFVPGGLALLVLWPLLVWALAAPWPFLAAGLLGGRGREGLGLRETLGAHAGLVAGLNLLLLIVWATTPHRSFWPEWVLLPTALLLAVHAWAVQVGGRPGLRRRLGGAALALESGAAAALWLFFVCVWSLTRHGQFWPVWPLLGLAAALLAHATIVLASSRGRERIEVLETTRAGAVDEADEERRRIERDLHDGAQARLVALGMSLGLAEQKLLEDPEAARALLAEARASTGAALRELRDLARGIHPPILTDRGLAAALDALATATPLAVDVDVDVATRPPAPVETAAYFVAAEALANAAKHAGAARISIGVAADGERLFVRVLDDGRGGADLHGAGLDGLRRRVEALDGTLAVTSPTGGPTTVEAVLPCAS